MGDLSKNLSVEEFSCDCSYSNCRGKLAAHMPLVNAIQDAVDHFAKAYYTRAKVTITDGNRCRTNNIDIQMKWAKVSREVAEKSESKHMYFIAADHRIEIWDSKLGWQVLPQSELYAYYCNKFPDSHGIKGYNGRTHLDTRKGKWRGGC